MSTIYLIIAGVLWTAATLGVGYYMGHRGKTGVMSDLQDAKDTIKKLETKIKAK